jgi:hypothetical protein
MPPGSSHDYEHDKVSPPASPAMSAADYDGVGVGSGGAVSPVEEVSPNVDSQNTTSPRQGSQIPVPRKAPPTGIPLQNRTQRAPPAKAWTQNVGKSPMMWDKYSGEPTLTGAGVPAQVKPGTAFNLRSQLRPTGSRAYQPPPADPEAQQKTTFREKASRFAHKNLTIDTRPPWKGASGRQAIVAPPEDNPGQPLPVPQRAPKRVQSPENTPQSGAPPTAVRKVAASPETATVASPETTDTQKEAFPPLEEHPAYRNNPQEIYASQGPPEVKQTGYPSPVSPTDVETTPTQTSPEHDYATRTTDDIILPKRHESRRSPERESNSRQSSQNHPDPTSRFSWTTTNTSTTYQHSPPPSPPPPMPQAYANIYSQPQSRTGSTARVPLDTAPTVLNRGHPTRRLGDQSAGPPSPTFTLRSISSTIRKPVPTYQPIQSGPLPNWRDGITARNPYSLRAPSIAPSTMSTQAGDKSLPKTPGELNSVDLVTALQAQQDDLFNQRSNIQRVIRDLEKPEPQNPLVSDIRARREKEKKLQALRVDLDEVARLEYDCGLRLHRAWKRREREDPSAGPSVLWVRRIASS